MDGFQAQEDAVTVEITSLSSRFDELQSEVSEIRNCHSSRVEKLETVISELGDYVKRALHNILPKVEALLANQASRFPTSSSVADRPTTNTDSPASWFRALQDGDADAILRLVKDGVDLFKRNEQGDSALHLAARAGHELVVLVLLENCRVDIVGHRGCTPLHCASAGGFVSIVHRLLVAGANVDVKDAEGNFALLLAAKAGHVKVVELLIDHGVCIDAVDKDDNSSIVAAARAEKWDVVKLLLQRGASAEKHNDKNRYSNAPLYLVIQHKQYSIIPLMLKVMEERKGKEMTKALFECDDEFVLYLFEDEVPGFCKSQEARDAMVSFAGRGKVKMLNAMLDIGIAIDGLSSDGESCLAHAAWYGKVETLKLLLDRGASVSLLVTDKNTALHDAAVQGHVECVRHLLAAGATVNIKNKDYKTPIDVAQTDEIRQILSSHSSQS